MPVASMSMLVNQHAHARKGFADFPAASTSYSGNGSKSKAAARRRQEGWDVASVVASVFLLALGIGAAIVSSKYMTGTTLSHGQIVGGMCALLGIIGVVSAGLPISCATDSSLGIALSSVAGSPTKRPVSERLGLPFRTALLVGIALAALGTFGLMDRAASDLGTHCLLAETSLRIAHLEETVTKLKNDDMMLQVFFRLNEMDDLISAVAEGSTQQSEVKTQMTHLQFKDRDLIRERVDRLQRHATALLSSMKHQVAAAKQQQQELQANTTQLQSSEPRSMRDYSEQQEKVRQLQEDKKRKEEDLWLLQKRMEAVESVLHYIETRAHDAHSGLSYEEYEIILNALLEGSAPDAAAVHAAHHGGIQMAPAAAAGGNGAQQPGLDAYGYPTTPDAAGITSTAASPVAILRAALTKDKEDTDALRAAFQRRTSNAYDAAAGDPRHQLPKLIRDKRDAARRDFESRFFNVYHEGAGHLQPDRFRQSLVAALDTLPGHCLDDEKGFKYLRWLCLGLAAAQAVLAYTAATGLASKLLRSKAD